jgi:tetratricopeptide (TPR) repeat protein
VLAKVLGVDISELYTSTADAIHGVVTYDTVDEYRGVHAARCRHHVIAEIVWQRCLAGLEREHKLLAVLGALNLQYSVDAKLFDALIRSDTQIDFLSGLDAKTKFFEIACQKDPENAYVRQHYGRMLLRENRLELALDQIEGGLGLMPEYHILLHTKGMILKEMAIVVPSLDLARKRMAQSEAVFRKAIAVAPRDSYNYQSLAELFLAWAKRTSSDNESATYLSKAEAVIAEGFKKVRDREGLWIVSANIQEWLGNAPRALAMLRQAQASPVAAYILGRHLLRAGNAAGAIAILEPKVAGDPDAWRASVILARAMLEVGRTYREVAAVLRLSDMHGMRDPRYVATLGGILFMDGEFSEAKRVFAVAFEFPADERFRTQFRPRVPGSATPLTMQGRVVKIRGGNMYVEVPGYPPIFCHGSQVRDELPSLGTAVSFTLGFNAMGAVGLSVRSLAAESTAAVSK